MDVEVSPGLFNLPLPINDKNIDKDAVKRKLLDVEHDLKSRLGRPEELAILNLLGLLKFSLKRYDDALEDFRAVLKKDPDNLNAMANMQHVLSKLYRVKEALCFQCQLEDLDIHTGDQNVYIKARSRCLAEQAYVFAADIHTDDASNKRYQQSNQIFRKALTGKVIDTPEQDFWEFTMAKNANKLFNSFTFSENREKTQDYLEESVVLFYGITQRVPGDPEYRWQSWRNMADIIRRINLTKHLSHSCVKLKELRHYIESDPEECMKKAVEISPDNPRLLARYGNFVYSSKRDTCTERALELLDRSISLDDSDYNFYAFSTRGTIRLKTYQWKLRQSKEDNKRYTPPGLELLEMASADLEKAIAYRNTSWDLMALADIYVHKANNFTTAADFSRRKCIEKAFDLLKQAEESNDQAVVLKDVSRARGRIFFDLGEYQEATDCFKMAVDREPAVTHFTGYYHELFRSFLCLLKSSQDETFLREMANSLRQAIIKYGGNKLITHCFGRLRKVYTSELQLFADFCEKIADNEGLLYVLKSKEPSYPLTPPTRQGGTLEKIWANPKQPTPRPKASSKRNLMDLFEALEEKPERPGNRSDVGLTASAGVAVKGLDTQEEDEGIEPLMSGIKGLEVRDPTDRDVQEPGGQPRPAVESQSGAFSPNKEQKIMFDFYVVHGDSDQDWVEDKLLHELETVRGLKGCTYTNDAALGSFVFEGKLELMKQCACILFLHGEDFKDGKYFVQQTLKIAKESGCVVIPIERDGLMVPDELSVMKSFDASAGRANWEFLAQSIKNTKGAPSYSGTKTELKMY